MATSLIMQAWSELFGFWLRHPVQAFRPFQHIFRLCLLEKHIGS